MTPDKAEAPAPPAIVDLPCTEPGCDYVANGPETGRGSAKWKLGGHKLREHGIAGEGKNAVSRRKKGAPRPPTDEEADARPVLGVVRDMAADIGGKGVPSADDLTAAFGRGLSYVSIGVAAYAVEVDPTIPDGPVGEARREALVDHLSISSKSSRDIMAPIGRVLAPTKLNRKYGRAAVENVDVVTAVVELGTVMLHWRRYFREVRYYRAQLPAPGPIDVASYPAANGSTVPGHTPAATSGPAPVPTADGTAMQSPPPTGGVVVDAAMIESMRRRRD